MSEKQNELKLIRMSDVAIEEIKWLWYPYIPYGKITVIQGDPGDGKTTVVLAITAAVTKGLTLPGQKENHEPITVIFQTAEDGLGDTVKPRLLQANADCDRVIVIDESKRELTLSDTQIEQALCETGAKLIIIDPLQAYLGAEVDMHRSNEIRPILKRISLLAERHNCAVVFVSHLNKGTNKSQYRGLGSIDIQAAARSVLTIGQIKDKPTTRAFAHGKSNLAPEGASIAFELDPETGFRWIGAYPITIDELLSGSMPEQDTTYDRAVEFLQTELAEGARAAKFLFEKADSEKIAERTLRKAKTALDIHSYKDGNHWFWQLREEESDNQGSNTTQSWKSSFVAC